MIDNPCYNRKTHQGCENRCTGCSTLCALWHEYVEKRDAIYQKKAKMARAEQDFIEHKADLHKRVEKKYNNRRR